MTKLTPYPHQEAGCKHLVDNNGGAVFAQPRTGKTLMVLRALVKTEAFPALIVCPSTVIASWYGALMQDGVASEDIVTLDNRHKGTVAKLRSLLILKDPKYVIINYEKLENSNAFNIRNYVLAVLNITDWKAIVLDESYRIASFESNVSKYIMLHKRPVGQFRAILTGTPICESPLDVVQPYIFLNDEFFGETNGEDYRLRYYNNYAYKWKPKSRIHVSKVEKFVKDNSFQVQLKDLGLGGEILTGLAILPMSKEMETWYRWLATTTIYERNDGEIMDLLPPIKTMFAQKVASGINPLTNEIIDTTKAEWIADLYEEEREPLLVLSRFTIPLQLLEETFSNRGISVGVIKGSVKLSDRETIRQAFQDGELDIVLAQENTVARGLDFSRLSKIIYYSNSFSYETRAQSILRGQNVKRTEPYGVVDLCIENSVDIKVVEDLFTKQGTVEQFIKEIDKELKERWGSSE